MTAPHVVHYLPDDKFSDFFVELMRSEGVDDHCFLVDPANPDGSLRHSSPSCASVILDPSRAVWPQARRILRSARTVVVHSMRPRAQEVALALPSGPRLFWSGWGDDYYHLMPGGKRALYEPVTRCLVDRLDRTASSGILGGLRRIVRRCGARRAVHSIRRARWDRVLSRTDLFSAPLREDYELLRAAVGPRFRAGYCQVNYGTVEHTFASDVDTTPDPAIIQLGNSAAPVGNHLDAAECIPAQVREHVHMIVPLSYGREDYAREIPLQLRRLGFRHMTVLARFLPRARYAAETAACGTAFFHARRQHALGNIGAALWRGARVHLNPCSPAFRFLRSRGAILNSCQSVGTGFDHADGVELATRIRVNRAALDSIWGKRVVQENARRLLQEVSR